MMKNLVLIFFLMTVGSSVFAYSQETQKPISTATQDTLSVPVVNPVAIAKPDSLSKIVTLADTTAPIAQPKQEIAQPATPPMPTATQAAPVVEEKAPTTIKKVPPHKGGLLQNFAVAIKAGTYGVGGDFYTSLHPNIKARLGFNYLYFNYTAGLDFDATATSGNDITVHVNNADIRFPNANLLIDLFPMRSGIFHFTLGAYFGQSKIAAYGNAPEEFDIEGYVIKPDANGNFSATLQWANVAKPYFGIGLGRTIPKRRVGFKFDLGVIYQGPYKIESPNMDLSAVSSEISTTLEDAGVPKILTELWPVMSFSIIVRIK